MRLPNYTTFFACAVLTAAMLPGAARSQQPAAPQATSGQPAQPVAKKPVPTAAARAAAARRVAARRAAAAKAAAAATAKATPPPAPVPPPAPAPAPVAVVNTAPVITTTPFHDTIPDKVISAEVREGVFEYDGIVAKVHLDYNIKDQGYLYFFVPNQGTAIVALVQTPNSFLVHDAIKGNTLNFSVNGHSYQLSSSVPLLGKERGKQDVYVRLDPTSAGLDRYPMFGFGNTQRPPYRFPAAIPEKQAKDADPLAPPIPTNLLPREQNTVTTTVPPKQ